MNIKQENVERVLGKLMDKKMIVAYQLEEDDNDMLFYNIVLDDAFSNDKYNQFLTLLNKGQSNLVAQNEYNVCAIGEDTYGNGVLSFRDFKNNTVDYVPIVLLSQEWTNLYNVLFSG